MCGIAGYVGPRVVREPLDGMLASLEHRGPDDVGRYAGDGVALGMTRLAIIDLATGRQPIQGDAGECLVFNGEIYNYRELRDTLAAAGHRFATRSDTEVLLHAWQAWGEDALERLRGMFAFALWRPLERTLVLARDCLGKKPLFYWQRDGVFAFASELKALLEYPAVGRGVDWAAFRHYLAFGYTPGDRSIVDGVAKLPAGHVATVRDGRVTLRRWWTLPDAGRVVRERGAALGERIRAELREAVRLRLESDVPLGVFLSGGVDSSAIVASMRALTNGPIATFSVGFGAEAPSHDELPYARAVARHFGTDHHEEVLEPKAADLVEAVVRAFDEPFADSSALPTLVVSEATARHVKVALSGIGGDEAFAGYPRHLGVRLAAVWARVPRPLRAAADGVLARLLPESEASRNLGAWRRRFSAGAALPMPERYLAWTRVFGDTELEALATPALRLRWESDVNAAARAAFATRRPGDDVDGAIRIDVATYLVDDLLAMADRMSMAHSLELRAPFCDRRLLETALALPTSVKLAHCRLKAALKGAFADVLPRDVIRRRKQGFMIPLDRWLRTDLRLLADDLLGRERVRARGLFDPAVVERLRAEHASGARSHGDRLWALMLAELWMRRYLDVRGAFRLG